MVLNWNRIVFVGASAGGGLGDIRNQSTPAPNSIYKLVDLSPFEWCRFSSNLNSTSNELTSVKDPAVDAMAGYGEQVGDEIKKEQLNRVVYQYNNTGQSVTLSPSQADSFDKIPNLGGYYRTPFYNH